MAQCPSAANQEASVRRDGEGWHAVRVRSAGEGVSSEMALKWQVGSDGSAATAASTNQKLNVRDAWLGGVTPDA